MNYTVREIAQGDDREIEAVIRSCLIEFGANHEGTAWADPYLGRLSQVYCTEGNKYFVATDEEGKILGGAGIGRLEGAEGICELQKMYLLPDARGTGIAYRLMERALEYAREHYERCYLETLDNMTRAIRFYEKCGFVRIYTPVTDTGHFACQVRYIRDL